MKFFIFVAALFLSVIANCSAAEEGRFQIGRQGPLTVLDTQTGQLWKADGDAQQGYFMRKICYLGPKGVLMEGPYEHIMSPGAGPYVPHSSELCPYPLTTNSK